MKDTLTNHIIMREVMDDLREKGARCCFLIRGVYPGRDISIRSVLKDGRIWEIPNIIRCNGRNEAIVNCATE
ncbi:hypothetical protein LCGC14_1970810 [marine sediment metagenome]|uniref:Uncharacterized protein n=1 Tax=marine sediment metagenome TaxID=412755 RepID=A0A0F9FCA8_9ZZZZ